jgi:hypothetical protein
MPWLGVWLRAGWSRLPLQPQPSYPPIVELSLEQPARYVLGVTGGLIVKHSLTYRATAAAIGLAVWAIMGAPLPSHPDARVAQSAGQR